MHSDICTFTTLNFSLKIIVKTCFAKIKSFANRPTLFFSGKGTRHTPIFFWPYGGDRFLIFIVLFRCATQIKLQFRPPPQKKKKTNLCYRYHDKKTFESVGRMEILFYFIFISSWSSEDLVDAWNSSARGGMPKSVHACTNLGMPPLAELFQASTRSSEDHEEKIFKIK